MDLVTFMRAAGPLVQIVAEVPWEKLMPREPLPLPSSMVPPELLGKRRMLAQGAEPATQPAVPPTAKPSLQGKTLMAKPGCTAADESGV
ncbi:MAG: hypothetical protein Q8P59_11275, partial [Dehalococcoidia bacterium]|nr:hypothetical protein [Dehalococcoidia bacterium]